MLFFSYDGNPSSASSQRRIGCKLADLFSSDLFLMLSVKWDDMGFNASVLVIY